MKETNRKVWVHEEMSVSELVNKFKHTFPYLQLEIFHNGKEASHYYPSMPLNGLTTRRTLQPFSINCVQSVQEVIDNFWEKMGLQISIGRKLANSNVETVFTSQWSLSQQNEIGGEIFNEFES